MDAKRAINYSTKVAIKQELIKELPIKGLRSRLGTAEVFAFVGYSE